MNIVRILDKKCKTNSHQQSNVSITLFNLQKTKFILNFNIIVNSICQITKKQIYTNWWFLLRKSTNLAHFFKNTERNSCPFSYSYYTLTTHISHQRLVLFYHLFINRTSLKMTKLTLSSFVTSAYLEKTYIHKIIYLQSMFTIFSICDNFLHFPPKSRGQLIKKKWTNYEYITFFIGKFINWSDFFEKYRRYLWFPYVFYFSYTHPPDDFFFARWKKFWWFFEIFF